MAYKSPIDIISERVKLDCDNAVYKAVQDVHINVDREELIKALQYDRNQYDKGYLDGCKETAEKFAERLKTQGDFVIRADEHDAMYYVDLCVWVDEICKEITEDKEWIGK